MILTHGDSPAEHCKNAGPASCAHLAIARRRVEDAATCRRGRFMSRALLYIACAFAFALSLSGCDKCGDPLKFNFPGVSACSDQK